MKKYKITYNDGILYDKIAYASIDECTEVMEDAMEQFPSISFKIIEI